MQYFAYSQKAFLYKYIVMLSDVDQFKHMSFANYLKLMFLATDALFLGYLNESFLSENRLKILNSRMQFKRQTVAADNLLIKINVSEIKDCKFTLLYTFVIEKTGELVSLGRQEMELRKINSDDTVMLFNDLLTILQAIRVDEKYLLYEY